MSALGTLDTDSFELKRVMRQEAHEKAFEIRVQSQRLFEKEKEKIVKEGKIRVDGDTETKIRNITTEINIKRSNLINQTRMTLMNVRNEFMKSLVKEALKKLETEIALPDNKMYQTVCKDLIVQGCIKFLEPIVLVKCREQDLEFIQQIAPDAQSQYNDLIARETDSDKYVTEIRIIEDDFIDPASEEGKCGGVILMTKNKKITCSNSLNNRLHLCYEESLPTLRQDLFPSKS